MHAQSLKFNLRIPTNKQKDPIALMTICAEKMKLKHRSAGWGQSRAVDRLLALHGADLGSMPGSPYGSLRTVR